MRADIVIVGGAVMGSSIAHHLLRLEPGLDVVVVEKDLSFRHSSTLLSDGNVRIQFNLPENISMSVYALNVLESFSEDFAVDGWRPDPAPRHQGNLFLTAADGELAARAGMDRQLAMGCDVEWLEPSTIHQRFPAYSGTGYVGGTFGPRDGSVDPNAVLNGYRRKASAAGARYLEKEVQSIRADDSGVVGVELVGGDGIGADVVVNAAGAWCAPLVESIGVDIPVIPVVRSVYVAETAINGALPSVFLPSGLYVLSETEGRFLIGWSLPDDPVGYDLAFSRALFDDRIWPELATALPAFDSLRVVGGWSGLYEVNQLDGNAILGEWPGLRGLYVANGFSGHGFQQCHAVGRHLAELITSRPPSLDLSRFGAERIVAGEPYPEHGGRII